MALRIHDPAHTALRRGIRAAIGVPLAVGLSLWLVPNTPGGLIAAFGSLGLIATCDFGGSTRRRLSSLLGAAAVGTVLIIIGALAGLSLVSAVVVTFIVATTLAFVAVLHGAIASGAPAMTIIYVASATLGVSLEKSWTLLAGWAIAIAVAIPISLFVLPRRNTGVVRKACARALMAAADAAQARADGVEPDLGALQSAQADLQRSYLGNPFRASGFNKRDRGLIVLVGQVQALVAAFVRSGTFVMPFSDMQQSRELAHQGAVALRAAAMSLRDPGAPAPSGLAIADGWQRHWGSALDVLTESGSASADEKVNTVYMMFPDRATAISAVRVVILTRRVLGAPPESYPHGPGLHSIPEPPTSRGIQELRAEASLRSPWARLALRTGFGLALAVLVVYILGLSHGFWVVLGVTAILRFDGLTTLKMAGWAVLGTFLGAGAGYLILLLDMHRPAWLWIGLILATFLAVWAQGALNFAIGQAAFSMFVIIGFSVLTWPPDLVTAEQRFQDITIGAIVSIVIALLLWPRGVLSGMIGNVSAAIRATNRLLGQAVGAMQYGVDRLDDAVMSETTHAILRSQEVVDLSLTSTNKGGARFAYDWQGVIDELRTPITAGHLLADWAGDGAPLVSVSPRLGACLNLDLRAVTSAWEAVADEVDGQPTRSHPPDELTLDAITEVVATVNLSDRAVADRVLATIWIHAWLVMSLHAAQATVVPARHPSG